MASSNYKRERAVKGNVRKDLGLDPDLKLFNNANGQFWAGKAKSVVAGVLTLLNPRKIVCGLIAGASDLIGWHSVVITQEMVGKRVAVFTALETKAEKKGVKRKLQIRFINMVRAAGGIAGFVKGTPEAKELIAAWKEDRCA